LKNDNVNLRNIQNFLSELNSEIEQFISRKTKVLILQNLPSQIFIVCYFENITHIQDYQSRFPNCQLTILVIGKNDNEYLESLTIGNFVNVLLIEEISIKELKYVLSNLLSIGNYSHKLSSIHIQTNSSNKELENIISKVLSYVSNFEAIKDKVDKFKINLVLRELLTNAIRHGNNEDCNKKIITSIHHFANSDSIFIAVKDEGEGFDFYNFLDEIKKEDELRIHHRGLLIIKEFCKNIKCHKSVISLEMNFNILEEQWKQK